MILTINFKSYDSDGKIVFTNEPFGDHFKNMMDYAFKELSDELSGWYHRGLLIDGEPITIERETYRLFKRGYDIVLETTYSNGASYPISIIGDRLSHWFLYNTDMDMNEGWDFVHRFETFNKKPAYIVDLYTRLDEAGLIKVAVPKTKQLDPVEDKEVIDEIVYDLIETSAQAGGRIECTKMEIDFGGFDKDDLDQYDYLGQIAREINIEFGRFCATVESEIITVEQGETRWFYIQDGIYKSTSEWYRIPESCKESGFKLTRSNILKDVFSLIDLKEQFDMVSLAIIWTNWKNDQ